ncbi:gg15455, related [Neospora caninum Liverpool]|uniref:Gg15455, related n=1 Tax=Neospora caninum (strain Liverpool) TaxID=572307 RepID=F0VB79_NEOCL|nr:gg15455, related [Neospora caninum Liverpool]CBZ51416.1 gg15455, related [Neospora caninum Liverpool]CEL68736.1 TPA: GG15455, related [Neospora caninum Liverpool]|eukprot:XP_003881449.1 gg15455, related [Neospora caninum Liverpool]
MENPNPTVLEDRPESDEDFLASDEDASPSSHARLASLFRASTRKPSWVSSFANPEIFYFPLLEAGGSAKRRSHANPQQNAEAFAETRPGDSPSVFQDKSAETRTSHFAPMHRHAFEGGNEITQVVLRRQKRDVRRQIRDYISLLKAEATVRAFLLEKNARERERWGRARTRERTLESGAIRSEKEESRERTGKERDREEVERRKRDASDAMPGGNRVFEVWLSKKQMRRRLRPREPFTAEEIFSYVKHIQDPEHPYSLEQLDVVAVDRLTPEADAQRDASSQQPSSSLPASSTCVAASSSCCLSSSRPEPHPRVGTGACEELNELSQGAQPAGSLSAASSCEADKKLCCCKEPREKPDTRVTPRVRPEVRAMELAYKGGKGRQGRIVVSFQPTIPHCSQATLIGLLVLVKLLRSAPVWMKSEVRIIEGKHVSYKTINRQLKDKERVSAAAENPALSKVLNRGLLGTDAWMDITDLLVLPE